MPGIADAVGSGRVRVDAIARWLQDVAYADIIDAGFDEGGAWVVRRMRMRVEAFPRFGELPWLDAPAMAAHGIGVRIGELADAVGQASPSERTVFVAHRRGVGPTGRIGASSSIASE